MSNREFKISLPEKQPYEGKATQKQKQKLWELGCQDREIIDNLGKKQASFLIDAMLRHHNRRSSPVLIVAGLAIFIGGGALFMRYHGASADPVFTFLSILGLGGGGLLFLAGIYRLIIG